MREFLSYHDVAYTEKRVDEDAEALEDLFQRANMRAAPVIFVGEEKVVGFDRARLESLLGIAAVNDKGRDRPI